MEKGGRKPFQIDVIPWSVKWCLETIKRGVVARTLGLGWKLELEEEDKNGVGKDCYPCPVPYRGKPPEQREVIN